MLELLSVVDLQASSGLYNRLLNELEIREPSPALLELIAQNSPNEEVRTVLSGSDREAFLSYCWGKDIVELLSLNPGVVNDEAELLSILRPLSPRSYSVASSPNANPKQVHLTVAKVKYQNNGRWQHGVASGFLADLVAMGDSLRCYFAPSTGFSLPDDDTLPIIMIGPGTGVAPFRGFLQERQYRRARGKSWLFFGDRNVATDFLYRSELIGWLHKGVLHRLDLAFSRDQEHKVYVQDRLRERAKELFQRL